MKKITLAALSLLISISALSAEVHLRERVYISTDKDVYVAGDVLWCSAFCVDVNTRKLSDFSEIAYLEIHSSDAMPQTGKIALRNGRGSGRIDLPNTLPTGNYRIVAYTAQSCNEEGYDYLLGSKTISIFNPLTNERVKNGVRLVDDAAYAESTAPKQEPCGPLNVSVSGKTVLLENGGSESVTLDLSVYHDDGIVSPCNTGIGAFLSSLDKLPANPSFTMKRIPEYEGEVLKARVQGTNTEGIRKVAGKFAFFSTPDSTPNAYASVIGENGDVLVYTSNFFGSKELFMEIEGIGNDNICHLELESPFVRVNPGEIAPLRMSPSIGDRLRERSLAMQISQAFESDTLYEYLPTNSPELFKNDLIRYTLDEYTRFPVLEEVIIEFVTELRVRKLNGKNDIQVLMKDSYQDGYFSSGSTLALLDGVPVFDHDVILAYDPILIKSVDIYPYTYFIGKRSFNGVVNFVTYKGSLPGFKFADNVRIVSHQGASYPQAYTGEGVSEAYPDYRQTIYWHPLITLAPGESISIECKTPAYGGRFAVVAEGVSESLEPVYSQTFMKLGPR